MESFKITAKEFLLLCTATDADEVYGVDDAYENLTEDNVEKEVRNAQKSLEEKNYIQSDFDGNSEIRDDLMELISCCVECNNVISVDHAQGNKGQTNVVYYIQDEKVVKSEKKDDIYIIGGESIYRQLLPYCTKAYITKIDHAYDADTYFPNLDEDPEWEMTKISDEQTYFDLEYVFTIYERR